jgi:hypothetical protein
MLWQQLGRFSHYCNKPHWWRPLQRYQSGVGGQQYHYSNFTPTCGIKWKTIRFGGRGGYGKDLYCLMGGVTAVDWQPERAMSLGTMSQRTAAATADGLLHVHAVLVTGPRFTKIYQPSTQHSAAWGPYAPGTAVHWRSQTPGVSVVWPGIGSVGGYCDWFLRRTGNMTQPGNGRMYAQRWRLRSADGLLRVALSTWGALHPDLSPRRDPQQPR